MRTKEVLRILDALDAAEVGFSVAGGWGVAALTKRRTRRHHDLDLVILDFEQGEPRACSAVAQLGYHPIDRSRDAGIWTPLRTVLIDDAGHRLEFLGIADNLFVAGYRQLAAVSGPATDTGLSDLASGTIGRRTVACLSAEIQVLFHTGYQLRSSDRRDVARLRRRGLA
jgi:lincosamide nucleotidyltransferase A/C/D/E